MEAQWQFDTLLYNAIAYLQDARLHSVANPVLQIIRLGKALPIHNRQAEYLSERCAAVLPLLQDGTHSVAAADATHYVERTSKIFGDIQAKFQVWTRLDFEFQVERHKEISDDIAACHQEVDGCLPGLSVISSGTVDTKWQDIANRYRQEDFDRIPDQIRSRLYGFAPLSEKSIRLTELLQKTRKEAMEVTVDVPTETQQPVHGESTYGTYDFAVLWKLLHPSRAVSQAGSQILDWTKCIAKLGQDEDACIGSGAFGAVYKGKWVNLPKLSQHCKSPPPVVIKVMHAYVPIEKTTTTLEREIKVWQALRHKHILPFVGISNAFGPFRSLVSVYMPHGTIIDFIQKYPEVERDSIILGIARGLEYLHSHNPVITHGDLKAINILVDNQGVPCICDFGLSRMLVDKSSWVTQASKAPGTMQWMAPELLDETQKTVTPTSDIYAYAMTIIEVLTGQEPWKPRYQNNIWAVYTAVAIKNERPQRPPQVEAGSVLWTLIKDCWRQEPFFRPSMGKVVSTLESAFGRVRSSEVSFTSRTRIEVEHDIWEGSYKGKKVALKAVNLRSSKLGALEFSRFYHSSKIWKLASTVRANYVLPLYGIVDDSAAELPPWQEHGNVMSFLEHDHGTDRIKLLQGIAKCIRALHSCKPHAIVHGGIKGENILINGQGEPILTDFSSAKLLEPGKDIRYNENDGDSFDYRWIAPEVYSDPPGLLSVQSDVYMFGMTALEIMTGEKPFNELRRDADVVLNVQQGRRPVRPLWMAHSGLDDVLWHLIEQCWAQDPMQRITLDTALQKLKEIVDRRVD